MTRSTLAIDGGTPAVREPLPPALHGVMEIGDAEERAVVAALRRRRPFRFLNKPEQSDAAKLEAAYRGFCGSRFALALGGGGTGALTCGLIGMGISSGDEVIIPGYTYIATAAACLVVGAIPILAEVDESLTLDPADVEQKITPHTRALLPVHMRGTPADMQPLMELARRHDLKVLEDVAQANGGEYRGRRLGSIGDAGAFSFQHYKLITAAEGGMLVTDDEHIYRRAAIRHDSAMQFWRSGEGGEGGAEGEGEQVTGGWPSFAGENLRLDEVRAALGLAQFDRLPGILERCRAIKRRLMEAVREVAADADWTPQRVADEAGDCGITLSFFCASPEAARWTAEALTAEGASAGTVHNRQIPDRHIYTHWDYVMERRTHDSTGWPWTAARRPITYSRDMLPRTLDLLGRCVTLGISQRWSDDQTAGVVEALRKVGAAAAMR